MAPGESFHEFPPDQQLIKAALHFAFVRKNTWGTPSADIMGVQLRVNGPRGEEKVIHLCDNEEQMKLITVQHLKKKIEHELWISTFNVVFLRDPGLV